MDKEKALWNNIRRLCYDSMDKSYIYYGAKGVKLCKRWHNYETFYQDIQPVPEEGRFLRKDKDKGYNPSNCYWEEKC